MRLPWSPQSVAVGASAAAASDAGAGEKSSLTTSADDTAVDISGSLSGAALKFNPIWHRMAETVTDKERIIVVEGKLEINGAVSETIFRNHAATRCFGCGQCASHNGRSEH